VLGEGALIPSQYRGLAREDRRVQRIFLDDLNLVLRVLKEGVGEVAVLYKR
jgi:hypothetical protein